MRAVGIDVGATLVWAVRLRRGRPGRWQFDGGTTFGTSEPELARLAGWCSGSTVAIDAPASWSTGDHAGDARLSAKFRVARCSEVALQQQGRYSVPWVTPREGGDLPTWMAAGFAVWRALGSLAPLEVYPHAVFCELLGRRPPPKHTADGRAARIGALGEAIAGLPADVGLWGHDALDAAAAAVVAADHASSHSRELRCEQHPASAPMWLPAPRG